jgi:hypothetical protein
MQDADGKRETGREKAQEDSEATKSFRRGEESAVSEIRRARM